MQISIGLYIDEFFYRQNETMKFYNDFRARATTCFYERGIFNSTCPYDTAKRHYEYYMISNMYIREIEDRMKELLTVIEIFEKFNKNNIIAKTSNVLEQLAQAKIDIANNRVSIKATKKDNNVMIDMFLDYFKNNMPLPNVSMKIAAAKSALHHHFQSTMKSRSHGKKYEKKVKDQKDDDDDAPRYYKHSSKHPDYKTIEQAERFLERGISPSPQNGQAALDVSIKVTPNGRISLILENNYFVIFYRTRLLPEGGSIYHGFIESWHNLKKRDEFRNKLVANDIITQNGKII